MSLRYVQIKPLKKTPPFRKIALATWRLPRSPTIYGTLEVDLTKANAWRKKHAGKGPKITVLPMVARAIAVAMEKYPDLNGYVRFGRIYLRQSIDMFFQVMTEHESGRQDLTGIHVTELNKKGVHRIADNIKEKVDRARKKKDLDIQKTSGIFNVLPSLIVRMLLAVVAFISYTLNLKFPGKVYPVTEVKVSSLVSGRIARLAVQEGEQVGRGRLLVELDPVLYQARVDGAEAALRSQQATAEAAAATLRQAEDALAEQEALMERGLGAERQLLRPRGA